MSRGSISVFCVALGCGGGGGGAVDAAAPLADADPTERATGFVANRAGFVELTEGTIPFPAQAGLRDRGDLPPAALLAAEGECEIWVHPSEAAQCEPACSDGYCAATDQCTPWPVAISAGPIEVTGLRAPLRFLAGEYGYQPESEPPAELFADDAVVIASAPGGAAAGFTLEAGGVAPLEAQLDLDFDVTLVIEDGVDETIAWTPEPGGAIIQLALVVGHHGAPYEAQLVCESADDGELTIPGGLIARLPDRANGLEQHSSRVARLRRDVSAGAGGPIELVVASQVVIPQLEHRR